MAYEIKPFSLDPKSVKGISEKILISHYENNYVGAVKRLNAIAVQLAELDFAKAPNFLDQWPQARRTGRDELNDFARGLFRQSRWRRVQHEARWETRLRAISAASIAGALNSPRWVKAEGGGSGWVLLSYSPHDKPTGQSMGGRSHAMPSPAAGPVIALDMYEHAYHMDYGAKAGAYVDAFMEAHQLG